MGRVTSSSQRPLTAILLSTLGFASALTVCYYSWPLVRPSRQGIDASEDYRFHAGLPRLQPRIFFPPETDTSPSLLQDASLTHNGGFLRIQTDQSPPIGYGVSMYHQIHCIEMLREKLAPTAPIGDHHHHDDAETSDPAEEIEHLTHCLDYLAQASVCAADDTIEKSYVRELASGKKVRFTNGIGITHQCKDYNAVRDAVSLSQVEPFRLRAPRDGDTLVGLLIEKASGLSET